MNTIIYNGKTYDAETIESYYDDMISHDIIAETTQEFFEEYIKLDPKFTDLFEYDFYPID